MPPVFSVADAHKNGVTARQLRNPDFGKPFFGTRTAPGTDDDLHLRCSSLATRMPRGSAFSHTTAALLYGAPLPYRHEAGPLHVMSPAPVRALRHRGTIGHSATLRFGEVVSRSGVPVTSPERTWCDLAAMLDFPDLVAVGDHFLCWKAPLTTIGDLQDAIARYPSRRGRADLRLAIDVLSPRSRSRPESLVRLALTASHLPVPLPNFEVRLMLSRRVIEIDLAYPAYKVGLEYQGDHHRADRAQWRRDIRRGNDAVDEGWSMIFFSGDDTANLPSIVASAERRLRSRGWVQGR
jgi:hypothetical protein